MRRSVLRVALLAALFAASGCYATKLVSAPMRVVGGAATLVPFAGDSIHHAVDGAADAVDDLGG